MRFGYTRVSTVAQTLHQQHDALKAAGASKIYSDTMSGARDDRPGLADLMDQLRAGDTVVVWKLDRLGRNMLHVQGTVKALTEMGVALVSASDGSLAPLVEVPGLEPRAALLFRDRKSVV